MFDFDRVPSRRRTGSVKWDAQARQFGSNDLTPFWIADMDFPAAPCITQALAQRLEHPIFGYSLPAFGFHKAFCQWFRDRHGWALEPDWLLPGQNAVTALTIALEAVTRPGDPCLVLTPAYDPFFSAVRHTGRKLVCLPLTEAGTRYELDLARFEAALASGVKCLIFCNPHNPGGKVWTQDELAGIAELCQRYDVTILSDDVHCDWAFAPHVYRPLAALPAGRGRTVTITAPSKTFNLAGLSACCLIVPDDALRGRIQAGLAGMFVKGPNLFAWTAMEAAYSQAGPWVDQVRAYVADNAAYAGAYLRQHAPRLRLFDAEGTFMLWLDCRALAGDSQALCRSLAEGYGVSFNSGAPYGEGGEGFPRMNIACPRATLEVGLKALAAWYDDAVKREEG